MWDPKPWWISVFSNKMMTPSRKQKDWIRNFLPDPVELSPVQESKCGLETGCPDDLYPPLEVIGTTTVEIISLMYIAESDIKAITIYMIRRQKACFCQPFEWKNNQRLVLRDPLCRSLPLPPEACWMRTQGRAAIYDRYRGPIVPSRPW